MLFLFFFYLFSFFSLFRSSTSTALPKKVLVLGGNGRVGSKIVSKLISQGIPTNVLVRNLDLAQKNPFLTGATLYSGDVNNIEDLLTCSKDCEAIISVHGMKPPRITRLSELFFGTPKKDVTHPYHINYLAIKKIITVMELQKIKKFIRLTGSLVGRNPFNFFVFLFNFILSETVQWNELAEMAIREAGKVGIIDYTVIRAPGITNDVALASSAFGKNTSLELKYSDNENIPPPARRRISHQDVANICLLGLTEPKLSKSTVYVSWEDKKEGAKDWETILQTIQATPDFKPILRQNHKLAAYTYIIGLSSILYGLVRGLMQAGWCFFRWIKKIEQNRVVTLASSILRFSKK